MSNPDGVPAWWGQPSGEFDELHWREVNRDELAGTAFGPEQRTKSQPASPLEPSMRVRSTDYGDGTVVAVVATGVQIMWDKPWLEGVTGPQLLTHEHRFAAGLERL